MMRFLAKRVMQGVVVLFVLETVTFFLVRVLPGNPFMGDRKLPDEVLAQLNSLYGLDASSFVQYARYWKAILVEGDFGPAGMLAAHYRNRWPDALFMLLAVAGICIPSFVIAPVLGITLGAHVPGLSVAGWDNPLCIVLPALALGAVNAAYVARLTRGGMVETLSSDFIRTARAKGAGTGRILWLHALRSGLLPAVSYLGPAFAALITGSFVVETCFQVPGMGLHFVNATTDRDYFLIQGLVLCYGVLIVAANLIVDVVLAWMNPRLRA